MIRRECSTARRRGAAAVEMAVVSSLVLAPMMIGLWEAGRFVEVKQILSNAAREGGRQASTGLLTNTQVQAVVVDYLLYAGLTTTNVVVTVSDLTTPGTDATAASQLDEFQITVTIPFSDVRAVSLSLVTSASTKVTGQANWYSMKDKPYPTWPTSPTGS